MQTRTGKLTTMAMLTAISFCVVWMARILPPVIGFLSYEPKDVVIVIGGFIFGPLAAFVIALLVSVAELLTFSTTGPVGLLMNVLGSCAFACTAAFVYKRNRTMRGAAIGLALGVVCMTVVMILWNYLITPMYMGVPRDKVAEMLIPVFLPFNLLKGSLNAALSILVYKPVVNALRRSHLLPQPAEPAAGSGASVGAMLASGTVAITCLLVTLTLMGIF